MKKIALIILVLLSSVYMIGCGKRRESLEEMQEPMSIETLSSIGAQEQVAVENKTQEMQPVAQAPAQLGQLPPAGPYNPTAKEIQAALKNANYYTGLVDGKIGPMTKKAIEDFQKANGLKADGKVGPRTWETLSKYLNPELPAPVTPKKKR